MVALFSIFSTVVKIYKHKVVGSNPIQANFLYGIEKP